MESPVKRSLGDLCAVQRLKSISSETECNEDHLGRFPENVINSSLTTFDSVPTRFHGKS